jgi:prevent-host-death family protein
MKTVQIHAAKTNLSRLIEEACNGEEIVIARGKKPVVRLVPIEAASCGRRFGSLRGRMIVDESFFEPLPDDELAPWEG